MVTHWSLRGALMIVSPLEQFKTQPVLTVIDDVWLLSNLSVYSALVLATVVALASLSNGNSLVPSSWSVLIESIYSTVAALAVAQTGRQSYVPLVYALFAYVLVANLSGNVPYAYTLTTSLMVSMTLSVSLFSFTMMLAVERHQLECFAYFVPSGTPLMLVPLLVVIETISYMARAVSLGIRLFSNMLAGHTLLAILSTFMLALFSSSALVAVVTLVPFAVFTALIVLEIAVSFIQAYVFTILFSSYLKDAIDLH